MRKIPSLFQRNYDTDRLVRDEVTPGCEWVTAGEGVATRKWDGTACLVRDGVLYKRYDAKRGKTPPVGFVPAQPEADEATGHWPGWLAVGDGPEDRWHREAFDGMREEFGPKREIPDGTYELLGPKVQGNPEGLPLHVLVPHGAHGDPACPRTFDALREYMRDLDAEGVVWHHPDGRMCKLKVRDFGYKRGAKTAEGAA